MPNIAADPAGTPSPSKREPAEDDQREWLEADGLGGYASGTVSGIRTRRYHALLLHATDPPSGRVVLVNGYDAWIEVGGETIAITSQRYAPDVVSPDGATRLVDFSADPWPVRSYRLSDKGVLTEETFATKGTGLVMVSWSLDGDLPGAKLYVRPLLSGRDMHSLHHENGAFDFSAREEGQSVRWSPYHGIPSILSVTNGEYSSEPLWFRNFQLDREKDRGLDWSEDLASPGTFCFSLNAGPACWMVGVPDSFSEDQANASTAAEATAVCLAAREAELSRRNSFPGTMERAADAYLVARGEAKTIIAGYPWFSDWGRDTFISLRGLCISTGRLDEAGSILDAWSGHVSEGMLPNYFSEAGSEAEYNSVDASLFYVIAVHEYLAARKAAGHDLSADEIARLEKAMLQILTGYSAGTRYGIRADTDGLLSAGEPGAQVTWMDARVGDWVITPRIGKPVEVQALWINALAAGSLLSSDWNSLLETARTSFNEKFWNPAGECLFDVVDVDHVPGTVDPTFRPNQILAVGGLPFPVLTDEDRARSVVDAVENRLWTPLGLRSLAPGEAGYKPHYGGSPSQRDSGYHQGPVWPWLTGSFIQGWLRSRGNTRAAQKEARKRFLPSILAHLSQAGIGHVSEIADGEDSFAPNGCPFQAWSLGELIRVRQMLDSPAKN